MAMAIINTITYIALCFQILIICSIFFGILATCSRSLFGSLFSLACLYFCAVWLLAFLGLEFLCFVILLVYIGALTVLFLFVIMTMPPIISVDTLNQSNGSLLGVLFPVLFFCPVIYLLLQTFKYTSTRSIRHSDTMLSNIEQIGVMLYTTHSPVFILCGFGLLIASICVIRIVKSTK